MAKKSSIEKNNRRKRTVARFAARRKALKAAEARLESLSAERDALEAALADPALYAGDAAKLNALGQRRGALLREIEEAEAVWLVAAEALQTAEAAAAP